MAASSKAMACLVKLAAALRASHSNVTLAVYLMASVADSHTSTSQPRPQLARPPREGPRDPHSLYIGDRKNLSFAFRNDEEMIGTGHASNGYHPPMYMKERDLCWRHVESTYETWVLATEGSLDSKWTPRGIESIAKY